MNIFIGTLGTICFLLLAACIVLNILVASVFIFRKNDRNNLSRDLGKKADYFFALLLLVFSLTCLHHIFILENIYQTRPEWLFVPVYFTLALGMALFYAVKLRLFPTYRFVASDIKHFILPGGQLLYFLILFLFASVSFREGLGRKFYSPFYGGLEMAIYIGTLYMYLFAAYRYTRFKISALRKKKESGRPLYEAFVLRRMLRVMLILFWINSAYIVTDFAMYELLDLSMHNFRGFTRFGDLSFAAMAGWAGLAGLQLLVRLPYLNSSKIVFSLLKKMLAFKKK